MKISGILKDDITTRTRLVDRPSDQLELLVHVLLRQGTPVELACEDGVLDGDPALVLYVEKAVRDKLSVPLFPGGPHVQVSSRDPHSIAALLRSILRPDSIRIDVDEDGALTT